MALNQLHGGAMTVEEEEALNEEQGAGSRVAEQGSGRQGVRQGEANHHHAAPKLAGPGGLPVQWAADMRKGVVPPKRKGCKAELSPTVCAPLLRLLKEHPEALGVQVRERGG